MKSDISCPTTLEHCTSTEVAFLYPHKLAQCCTLSWGMGENLCLYVKWPSENEKQSDDTATYLFYQCLFMML